MKNYIIVVFLFIISLFAQEKDEGKLEDITIKGELKLNVESKRPKLKIDFNVNEVVIPTIKTEEKFLTLKPKELLDLKKGLPTVIVSEQTISAHLNNIVPEPVGEFELKLTEDIKISRWELTITDAKGELFYKFSGRKSIPKNIIWDGRNKKKEMIRPGKWYSYFVTLVDQVGRTYTITGQPFNFPAILHQEKNGLIISLSNESIFGQKKEATEITNEGLLLLRETSDIIKRYHTLPLKIEVYTDDKSIAIERAKKVAKFLTDLLIFPEDRFQILGETAYIADHRIDVIIVNK